MNKNRFHYNIATLFGAGNVKYAPGTLGSLIGLIFVYILHDNIVIYSLIFLISFILGVISSDKVQHEMGEKDPNQVIIDEFACMFVAFLFIPQVYMTGPLLLTGFTIFRILDITKIPPINLLEKLKGGYGIMMDDLACGVITAAILHLLIFFKIFH